MTSHTLTILVSKVFSRTVGCDRRVEMLDRSALSETFVRFSWCSPDTQKYVKPLEKFCVISGLARTEMQQKTDMCFYQESEVAGLIVRLVAVEQ